MKRNHWGEAPVHSVDEGIFFLMVLLTSGFFSQCDWPLVCQIVSVESTFIREVQNLWNNKTWKVFFQIFFIAQIQVAQQYSSLTTQNNSMAVTRKARIHKM